MEIDIKKITDMGLEFAPKLAVAILTLIVGFWLIGKVRIHISKAFNRAVKDETLSKFLSSVIVTFLKVIVLLSVVSQLGVDTTSFLAIFGALMVGVGMAFNGSLGHLASGIMLMIFKPFKVGDLVKIGSGETGTVEAINAFNTTLATLDNKRVIVANSNVTGNTITNISGQGVIGVELTFGIGYNDSIDQARKIILDIGRDCPFVINTPEQKVVVAELADSSVNLATRPFCKSEHYWDTYFYMQEHVKKAFDANGVSIPYPQLDIHQD